MHFKFFHIVLSLFLAALAHAVAPSATYNGSTDSDNIQLRIGNGGAGQSGLIEVLSNAFIKASIKNGTSPFAIAWYKSDTTETINYLKAGIIDIGITYSPAAEKIAIKNNIAKDPAWYLFRDHFLLVGPKSNPARISPHRDIRAQFSDLYTAAENAASSSGGNGSGSETPVRFLSRFDKSATNIKDSQLWLDIGQVPWASPSSTWYHRYIAYPIQALNAAIELEEYTITDRGTFLSIDQDVARKAVIYKAASDDPSDPLLNPAHILIGKGAKNEKMAEKFTAWAVRDEGQEVITGFEKNGRQLYTGAPVNRTAWF